MNRLFPALLAAALLAPAPAPAQTTTTTTTADFNVAHFKVTGLIFFREKDHRALT